MRKKYYVGVCVIVFYLLMIPQIVFAHPGRTDAIGCHTCRTNCEKWGLSAGEYHCHNGSGGSSGKSNSSTRTYTYGCTDPKANNYNANASKDDGSCKYIILGCMDSKAINYNANANTPDGSCQYESIIEELKDIKYNITYKKNKKLKSGTKKVKRKGKKGKVKNTYRIIKDESGKEFSREKITSETISKPVTKVVYKGTRRRVGKAKTKANRKVSKAKTKRKRKNKKS